MKQFTIEVDEMICKWLEHVSEITGKSIESIIASGISNKMIELESIVYEAFTETLK